MADHCYVATRKGLFELKRIDGTWTIVDISFLGDPVTNVLADVESNHVFAALNLGHFGVKFRRRSNGDWQDVNPPSLESVTPANGESAPSVQQIWSLQRGPGKGELWAGTIPAALFRSHDFGDTWQLNQALWDEPTRTQWFGGGYDQAGIHTILNDPRNPGHWLIGISCGGVWHSEDDGLSWTPRCQGLRAEYMPPDRAQEAAIQDPHLIAQCQSDPDHLWMQHHNGIFHSTDRGRRWRELRDIEPSTFGFAVAVHPSNPKTAWFVPAIKDACRVPRDGRLVVTRTRDGGARFEQLGDGLPAQDAYDLVYRHALDIDREGRTLAFGSTTGGLWVSDDQGDHWTQLPHRFPPIYAVRFPS